MEFNNDYWLPNSDPYQQGLNYLEHEFQPGFGSIAVLTFPDSFFTEENIDFFRKILSIELKRLTMYLGKFSVDATVIINQEDMLTIQTYDEAFSDGNIVSVGDYQRLFIDSPYFGKLLSDDFRSVGLSISIDKKNDGNDLMRRVGAIETLRPLCQNCHSTFEGLSPGDAAIYYEMDASTQRNLFTLLPLALILLLGVAWLFLKQWRSVLIVVIPTIINLGLVPIFIVLLGHYITIINVTLFILVLVITIADGIHMLNYWERYVLNKSPHPIADTIRSTWLPCFITSVTTAVGFGSFATSSIIPLNQYGIQSFLVMIFAYIIVMTGVPFLLRIIPPRVRSEDDIVLFPSLLATVSNIIQNHTKKVVLISLFITLMISQALWKARTETSFISVFLNHLIRFDNMSNLLINISQEVADWMF